MARRRTTAQVSWAIGDESEERALLRAIPGSSRLRRILQDLEAVMMSEGFLHLGVSDLASRLHCSKVTLYRLAESRDDLFEFVIELWLARLRDLGRRRFEDASAWSDRLLGFLDAAIVVGRPSSIEFMRDLSEFPGGRRAILQHQERRLADLVRIIEAGIEAGAFHPVNVKVAADMLLLAMRRFIEPEYLSSVGLSLAEAAEAAYEIFEYGLLRPARAPERARPSRARGSPQWKRSRPPRHRFDAGRGDPP